MNRPPLVLVLAMLLTPPLVILGCSAVGYDARSTAGDGPGEPFEVTALRSQVATLEAELYRAERERCPNLGVVPVAAPRRSR